MPTCVVADRSNVVTKVASRVLFGSGIDSMMAASGEAILEIVRSHAEGIDVALVDEDLICEDFSEMLKGASSNGRIRLFALVIDRSIKRQIRLKRSGVEGFLLKPFSRVHVERWIKEVAFPSLQKEGTSTGTLVELV